MHRPRMVRSWTKRASYCERGLGFFQSSYIPKPTWRIADLQLDVNHPPVSELELQTLAKRALIAVPNNNKDQVRQDLGNLLHMIDQVSSFIDENNNNMDHHPSMYYDTPRGVSSAPVRKDNQTIVLEDNDTNNTVYETYLKPNMKVDGAQEFFEIQSKTGQ